MPALKLRDGHHLAEDEPVDVDVARLGVEHRRETVERERDRVHAEPRPRRVRGRALEDDARVEVAEAAELQRVVGRLEADHELRLVDEAGALEDAGQRVLGRAELLAREEEEREVVGELGLGRPAGELDHHREPALHVARAEADDGTVLDPAGQVALGGDGVGVARRAARAACPSRLAKRTDSPSRIGRIERHGSPGRSRRAAASFRDSEGMLTRSRVRWASAILRTMIPRIPEPERGFVLAVLAQGVDPEEELAEVERAGPHGGRRAGRSGRAAPRATGAAHVRRQGEARGAEGSASPSRTPRACSSTTSSIPRSSATSRTRSTRASSTARS